MSWWCCCEDVCPILIDDFDCCPARDGICYGPDLVMLDTQDLGQYWDWENATGEWWNGQSPDPQQVLLAGDPCDDGALYEITGTGLLLCRAADINSGFMAAVDIIDYEVGTHFRWHIWCSHTNPSGGSVILDFQCTGLRENPDVPGTYQWVLELSLDSCSKTYYEDYIPFYHTYAGITVGYDGVGTLGFSLARLEGSYYPIWEKKFCNTPLITPAGYYTAVENMSGSGIPLILDNYYWGRWSIRQAGQRVLCFAQTNCRCYPTIMPETTYLYIHFSNCGPAVPPPDIAVELHAVQPVEPCNASCTIDTWASDWISGTPCGASSPTMWWRAQVSCAFLLSIGTRTLQPDGSYTYDTFNLPINPGDVQLEEISCAPLGTADLETVACDCFGPGHFGRVQIIFSGEALDDPWA